MANLNFQPKRTVNETNGLSVGMVAPLFSATDSNGDLFSLEETLKNGPVVIIFYRGFWCPYCNKHLAHLQDNLRSITEKGATVIALSPEKPEYLEKMVSKTGAKFMLLYDEEYKIADAFDLTFTPNSKQLFVYNYLLNGKLKKSHSDDSQRLPIPATYIIGTNGTIVWRQFDPDYKKRSTVKDIINNLS
jgi:peroxiredoxin